MMKLFACLIVIACITGERQAVASQAGTLSKIIEQLESLTEAKSPHAESKAQSIRTCDVMPNPSLSPTDPLYQPITGTVTFTELVDSVQIDIALSGFSTTDALTEHGFHVHTSGDVIAACEDAGGHFNPFSNTHGAPSDTNRHVGDLGNIIEDANGDVTTSFTDGIIEFNGAADITGRSIVIHETFDDLGLGGFPDSNTTGHAGARLACCTIAVADIKTAAKVRSSATQPFINNIVLVTVLLICSLLHFK